MKAAEPLRVEKRHPLETQGAMDITCQSDPIQTLAVTSPLADDFISCPAPGSLAAVSAATAASAAGVLPATAASVPPAASACLSPSVYPASRVPGPVSAGVGRVPAAASQLACPAAAGTSCPASGCPYLECSVPRAEGREDERLCWVEQRYSLSAPDFLPDWLRYRELPPLWPGQRHGH